MHELLEQEMGLSDINEYVLLDIAEPLMTLIESSGDYYFTYVLQNRRVKSLDGKRTHVYELLVSKTTLDKIISFLDAKITIHELIMNTEVYTIGKISNKVFPKKLILDLDEIQDKFPRGDFYLEPLIPNRIDTEEVKQELIKLNIK